MSNRVIVGDAEFLEAIDYNRLGSFPQAALDDVVSGAIGYPAHWSAFTVSQKTAQTVVVTPGRYFEGEAVYASEESVEINLITYFPLAPSDEKWIALILRGAEVEIQESRAFETSEDPETSQPVAIATPVIARRAAHIVIQQGAATPAPANRPAIAETDSCIAFVRITVAGIQEIVPGEGWRAKTLHEVEGRVTAIELRVQQLFEDTETIRTDLGNVASEVSGIRRALPPAQLFAQIVRDTARLAQMANLPDEARNYWFDQALVKDDWDFAAGGFFRINEGIRFQFAAQRDHMLRVLNADDPAISIWGNKVLLPAYEEVTRITSPEGSVRKDISNVVHTVTTAVQHQVQHERIRYGETVNVCENTAGWGEVGERKASEIFRSNGEEWVSKGLSDDPWNNNPAAQNGHLNYAVQRVIRDTYTETYTTYNVETFGLSGAVHAQTFLVSQVMVATSIELNLTRVGPTGDIMLAICLATPSGAPDYTSVITRVTKLRSELANGWNKFAFEPTLLEQGKRYAWFVVTTGNHQLMANNGNAFNGGTMFISSDGTWSQGTATEDFTFRLNAAKFKASRVVVPFESLELENGMTEIELVYQAWSPALTAIIWEVRAYGQDEWVPMDARIDNPLANLPPLVQLRAVLTGTEDVAPAIMLTQYARAIAGRMRPDMRAFTKLLPFGFASTQAQVILNMDYFEVARHTASPKLVLANDTVVEPTAVTEIPDPIKATRRQFVANFDLPAGTQAARVRIDATTNSVINVPFGQDVQLNAF